MRKKGVWPKPRTKPRTKKKPAYSTTRAVRDLIGLVREWMRADDLNRVPFPGELDIFQMLTWVTAHVKRRPEGDLARAWRGCSPALMAGFLAAWPHLRGPTREEWGAAYAERHNARLRAKAGLFADMPEELGFRYATPADLLADQKDREEFYVHLDAQPTVEQRSKSRLDRDKDMGAGITLRQCRVWGRLLVFHGDPHPDEAFTILMEEAGNSPSRARAILLPLLQWAADKTVRAEAEIEEKELSGQAISDMHRGSPVRLRAAWMACETIAQQIPPVSGIALPMLRRERTLIPHAAEAHIGRGDGRAEHLPGHDESEGGSQEGRDLFPQPERECAGSAATAG